MPRDLQGLFFVFWVGSRGEGEKHGQSGKKGGNFPETNQLEKRPKKIINEIKKKERRNLRGGTHYSKRAREKWNRNQEGVMMGFGKGGFVF